MFFGIALFIVGASFGLEFKGTALALRLTAIELFLLGGPLVSGLFFFLYKRSPQAAVELSVNSTGLHLVGPDGRTARIDWDDPKTSFNIYDWRALPNSAKSAGAREVQFVLDTKVRFQNPIPLGAVEAIIDEAKRHHAAITGWSEEPAARGQIRLIAVSLTHGVPEVP